MAIFKRRLAQCPASGVEHLQIQRIADQLAYSQTGESEYFIDNLLVQIHLIIEIVLVDWPCATGL